MVKVRQPFNITFTFVTTESFRARINGKHEFVPHD